MIVKIIIGLPGLARAAIGGISILIVAVIVIILVYIVDREHAFSAGGKKLERKVFIATGSFNL